MGATNCPETPRQRMISMMYLVLTALLALNVSAEIINAFVLFDETLTETRKNFESKNEQMLGLFENAMQDIPVKTKPWLDKATEVHTKANEVVEMMQEYKKQIIDAGGGLREEDKVEYMKQRNITEEGFIPAAAISKKDDLNAGGQIMVGADEHGEGLTLKAKIEELREYLLSIIKEEELKAGIEHILSTEDHISLEGDKHAWHLAYFDHMPLVACITSLSKLQSDVRNAEADVLNYLYGQIEAGSFKFNKLDGTVIAKSNYVMSGDHYEAEIFLAAFDTTQKPEIFIGEYDSTTREMKGELGKDYIKLDSITRDGKGIYKVSEGVGYHEVKGIIHFKTKDKILKFPFNNEYQVAQGSVVISPTKMNVFYIGVENPVEISVPGVAMDKIFPSISGGGGSLRKAQKGYIVTVSSPTNDCNISVGAEINGNRRSMGSMKFRVKRVPDPVAMVAGQKGGDIAKTKLVSQTGVSAVLENFDFDLKFNIVKFTVSANIDGFTQDAPCSGSRFSPKALEIMQKQKRGQKVYIEDVMAKGPDGTTRKLGTLTFKLQ